MKNCDRGLENAARGRGPRAAFSSPRSQFFTTRTDPKPVNNLFIFFQEEKKKGKETHASVTVTVVRENPNRAKNQLDCRIRYHTRLEKNKRISHQYGPSSLSILYLS